MQKLLFTEKTNNRCFPPPSSEVSTENGSDWDVTFNFMAVQHGGAGRLTLFVHGQNAVNGLVDMTATRFARPRPSKEFWQREEMDLIASSRSPFMNGLFNRTVGAKRPLLPKVLITACLCICRFNESVEIQLSVQSSYLCLHLMVVGGGGRGVERKTTSGNHPFPRGYQFDTHF